MLTRIFAGPLLVLYWGLGLWGFLLVLQYTFQNFGFAGTLVALFVFPAAYGIIPIWAGLADNYWLPALVCYSPIALLGITVFIASLFEGRT